MEVAELTVVVLRAIEESLYLLEVELTSLLSLEGSIGDIAGMKGLELQDMAAASY